MVIARCKRIVRRRFGFTLIELMVVMVILVLLAGGVSVMVVGRIEEAKRARAKMDIQALEAALDMYYAHNGRYPATEQGLRALIAKPTTEPIPRNWQGPYLKHGRLPKDPWGNDYQYIFPGKHNPDSFDLYSFGRDGKEGGVGLDADIGNWEEQ
ncbi:MAG: type II secretion system major pseudopilin GspG [Armatimonadota bacterium]|nr:type II secretion system major pseudopilin GspG [Armatimonadota bacterium]MCX7776888.1 type II secretion system major pseudopilin GspG [Armatimonadota bacterium]MDW8024426.1 type II secretion system major pseudopilin GspG [Armatimonadota bacterium]